MLAVEGGGGSNIFFFSCLTYLFSFSLSLEDGFTETEILSERAVKPKTNQ